MTITASEKRNDGPNRRVIFKHMDDAGSPAAAVFYPGFKPTSVVVENTTDRIRYEWHHGMNSGDYIKTVAAGTRTLETDDALVVEVDAGDRPSITLAAAIVTQNDVFLVRAEG